jgi:sporulation protein YlmC with PRC-barrel domain
MTMTQTATGRRVDTWNLMRAGDLQGRSVRGIDGQEIGTVDDLYLDYDEHTVRYVTLDVGGFLGIGSKTVLVPFERLQWADDGEHLFLDADREMIDNAPEFQPGGGYDREYETTVITAWGVPAYWNADTYGTDHAHWRDPQRSR